MKDMYNQSKNLWRYGEIIEDTEYENVRVLIFWYNDTFWYEEWCNGELVKCHELCPPNIIDFDNI